MEKKLKFTKGDWQPVYKHYKKEPKTICIGVGIIEKINGGEYTAMICDSLLPDTDEEYIEQREQIEANMKLIAAGPDLLNALIELMNNHSFSGQPEGQNIRIRCQNAINKATK